MISISLCMVVCDAEEVLARCLDSVYAAMDEIIIVDIGSRDNSKRIAARYTDQVLDYAWADDFAAARNYAFARAKRDYILWLEADETLPPESLAALQRLKQELDPNVSLVTMPCRIACNRPRQAQPACPRERLIKNHAGFHWQGAVHETITPRGLVRFSDIMIEGQERKPEHIERNIRIFRQLLAKGGRPSAQQHYYHARELYCLELYAEAARAFEAFLALPEGRLEQRNDAHRLLSLCLEREGRTEKALSVLLFSLLEDAPQAEICCDIGRHLIESGSLRAAIFWYETAAKSKPDLQSGAVIDLDCYDFIPYLQLGLCHYLLGNFEQSRHYYQLAGAIHPEAALLHSRRFPL